MRPKPLLATAAVAVLSMSTAATCTGGEPPACVSAQNLETSVDRLGGPGAGGAGLDSLDAGLQQVDEALTELAARTAQRYGPRIDALRSGVARLAEDVTAARANPSPDTLRAVASALAAVATDAQELHDAVSTGC